MIHITEAQCAGLISHEMAFAAITRALIAAASPTSSIFPVVLGHASDPQNRFTIKSGADADLTGLKIGSYFPTNDRLDLPRHDSVILLFDQTKGKIGAIVEAGKLNAYRTAAADAVATDILASKEASTVALFGTGHQAAYEALALSRIRPLKRILVVGRDPARTRSFATTFAVEGSACGTVASRASLCFSRRDRHRHRSDSTAFPRPVGTGRNPYFQHGLGRHGQAGASARLVSQGQIVLRSAGAITPHRRVPACGCRQCSPRRLAMF